MSNVQHEPLYYTYGWSHSSVLSPVFFQVYEQLYDTLEIVGGPQVRAQATAKVFPYRANAK